MIQILIEILLIKNIVYIEYHKLSEKTKKQFRNNYVATNIQF